MPKISTCCLMFYLVTHIFAGPATSACDVRDNCSCCAAGGDSCSASNDYKCESPCIEGYWGARCKNKCPTKCLSCNQMFGQTGECYTCINGTYGLDCSNFCQQCLSCIKDTGVCTGCAVGHYGTMCQHNCSVNCLNQHCNVTSGRCNQCIIEHYGDTCNQSCTGNCVDRSCDRESGICSACIDGYFGVYCNKTCIGNCTNNGCKMSSGICTECKHGLFGYFCNKSCPLNCRDSLCNRDHGNCTIGCIDNFAGDKCAKCQIGKYGYNCSLNCPLNCLNDTCNRNDGTCVSGCKPGYSDERFCCANTQNCSICSSASNCTHCKNGTYGHTCGKECPTNCHGSCDKATGDCSFCKMNYYGRKCEKNCPGTCLSITSQTSRCNPIDGTCTFDCKSGFYGNMCEYNCSTNCNGSCDKQSGECLSCTNNRFGKVCEQLCPYACAKMDMETVCNKTQGHCLYGCVTGFHGDLCDNNCSTSCIDMTCNRKRGYCLLGCVKGFYGDTCDNKCSLGCTDASCNISTGYCTKGCDEGLTGLFCSTEAGQSQPSNGNTDDVSMTIAGVSAGAGVLALLVVTMLIVVIRKRRSKPSKRNNETHQKVKVKDTLGRGKLYENVDPNEAADEDVFVPATDHEKTRDEHTYYNSAALKLRTEELYRYLSKTDETYQKEFLMLPTGLIKPYSDAKTLINAKRNRYNMVYPYDDSRVKVKDGNSDYINASYIDGYKKKNAYIACLGPTKKILGNDFSLFWKMIWQEKVETIVMLTKLKEGSGMKCDQYWPNAGKSMRYGNVKVITTGEEEYAEFIVRNMTISMDKEERQFHHIHFTAWPDKGVPSDVISIVNLRNKVLRMRRKFDGPLVVHCSAGIGRTGTYIALDILIRQGQAEQSVDVLGCIIKMRDQRVHLVQTVDQYKYLHHAVLWSLSIDTEPIPLDRFVDLSWIYQDNGLTKMLQQLQMENWYDTDEEKTAVAANKMIPFANRDNADIPGNRHAVRIIRYDTNHQMKADYINAVFIDGYRRQDRFIAAQTPLPETVTQFLDIVAQKRVSCIIDLEPHHSNQDAVGEYCPEQGQELQNGNVVFKTTNRKEFGAYVKQEIQVVEDGKVQSSRVITHYQFSKWSKDSVVPDPIEFVQLIHEVEKLVVRAEETGPIIAHCMNGADRSALFCAMWLLIERIGIDYSVSVLNTLRQVKSRRRMAIPNKEQIEFCFKGVAAHINLLNQNVYSNM